MRHHATRKAFSHDEVVPPITIVGPDDVAAGPRLPINTMMCKNSTHWGFGTKFGATALPGTMTQHIPEVRHILRTLDIGGIVLMASVL